MDNSNISLPLSYKALNIAHEKCKLNFDDNKSTKAKKIVSRVLSNSLLTIAAAIETVFFTALSIGATSLYFVSQEHKNYLEKKTKLSAQGCVKATKNIFKNSYNNLKINELTRFEWIKAKIYTKSNNILKTIKKRPKLTLFLTALLLNGIFKYNFIKLNRPNSESPIDPKKLSTCIISKKNLFNRYSYSLSIFSCDKVFNAKYKNLMQYYNINLSNKIIKLVKSRYRKMTLKIHPDKCLSNNLTLSTANLAMRKLNEAKEHLLNIFNLYNNLH